MPPLRALGLAVLLSVGMHAALMKGLRWSAPTPVEAMPPMRYRVLPAPTPPKAALPVPANPQAVKAGQRTRALRPAPSPPPPPPPSKRAQPAATGPAQGAQATQTPPTLQAPPTALPAQAQAPGQPGAPAGALGPQPRMDLSLAPGYRASQSLAQQAQSPLAAGGQPQQAEQGVSIRSVQHGDGRLNVRVQTPWSTYCLRSKSPATLPMSDRPMDRTALPTNC